MAKTKAKANGKKSGKAKSSKPSFDVCEMVTNRLIEQLEKGIVPWTKPWNDKGSALRWLSNKRYRGINTFLLPPGEYASFKQIKAAGGEIIEGEEKNGFICVYWHWFKVKEPGQDDIPDEEASFRKMAKPFYYRVWEINTQCTGLESKVKKGEGLEFNPIEKAEELLGLYENGPRIQHGAGKAAYSPIFDYIKMPGKEDFFSVEGYYATLFHELVHSTGSIKRLRRPGVTDVTKFGTQQYAKEELVAEMGASMLCAMAGIDNTNLVDNSASYIHGWLQALRDDKKFIFSAASQAQAAVNYMVGDIYMEEDEEETEGNIEEENQLVHA